MAKKTLTPEQAEIKAMKKAKSSQNWTKFWAIVLAAALTLGVVALGKNQADKAIEAAGTVQSGDAQQGGQSSETPEDEGNMFESNENSTPSGDNSTPSGDNNSTPSGDNNSTPSGDNNSTPSGNNQQSAQMTKADAVALLNKVTAAAAKGNYKWTRVCDYTSDGAIDVGSATSTLNGIITQVDPNASLDTVVGGFLGIGNKEATVSGGQFPETGMSSQDYMLKAMTLKESDIKNFVPNGNKYQFQLNACSNPQKDNSNALHHATNDFFTHSEVENGLKNQLGSLSSLLALNSSDVTYSSIAVIATIEGEKLTNLQISYTFAATLNLRATLVPITGKGKATNTITYSDITY